MLYNRLGRRRTFAMYTKSSAWMNDCFRSFKGFSLQISSLGSRAWWIGLLLSIIHFKLFFKHLKILPFFLPPSSIMSINISQRLAPSPPPKKNNNNNKQSPSALPENRHKIDNYLRKVNFFTLWSSPPLWNAWFSCHTTIRCSLVGHPVHGGKLLDRAVISSCCCHADLKIQFNSYLVDWDFICI